jgi:hypothetical protein
MNLTCYKTPEAPESADGWEELFSIYREPWAEQKADILGLSRKSLKSGPDDHIKVKKYLLLATFPGVETGRGGE